MKMADNIKKLSTDELDAVNGGALFNASRIQGSDPNRPWEVLDERGNIITYNGQELRFASRDDAVAAAARAGASWNEVDWAWVQDRRR